MANLLPHQRKARNRQSCPNSHATSASTIRAQRRPDSVARDSGFTLPRALVRRILFSHGCVVGDDASLNEGRDGDEQAAYAVAACPNNGSLGSYFNPASDAGGERSCGYRGVDTLKRRRF